MWVSCNPLCSPVKHDYGHCVDGDARVLFFVIVLDQISRDLVTERNRRFPGYSVGIDQYNLLSLLLTLHFGFCANITVGALRKVLHLVLLRLSFFG